MSVKSRRLVISLGIVLIVVVAAAGLPFLRSSDESVVVSVNVPDLSPQAAAGRDLFDANCAQCHGVNGAGSDKGPPLVHNIYNPGHHADASFLLAAKRGVAQHHWPFGNMPPQPQVSDDDIALIIRYVRELQQANGIAYEVHEM